MTDYRVRAGDIEEDQVTSLIESYSAQLPSSFFLGAAGVAMLAASIAARVSRTPMSGSVASNSPVEGLWTVKVSLPFPTAMLSIPRSAGSLTCCVR